MEEKKLHPNLVKMISQGIPVSKAEFNAAVNNADNVPENYFSFPSALLHKQCKHILIARIVRLSDYPREGVYLVLIGWEGWNVHSEPKK